MSGKTKKWVSLLMALTLLVVAGGTAAPAKALSGPIITPMWTNTVSIDLSLGFNGSQALCGAVVTGRTGTNIITGTVTLARRNTDGTYSTVKTWSGLQTYSDELLFDGTYYVATGYTYRLTIVATVYYDGIGETVSGSFENYAG